MLLILASLPINSFALVVGTVGGNNRIVTDVEYSMSHLVFENKGGYVQFLGSELKDVDVLFEKYGEGFVNMGKRTLNTDTLVKYALTPEETQKFVGRMRIGNQTINLGTGNFPNIQNSNKQTVNKDTYPDSIIFSGNYLNTINTGDITGTYGSGLSATSIGTGGSSTALTLNSPLNPGPLGYQNIVLKKTISGDPRIEIKYTYENAFRIIESLNLSDVRMFPNTGAKGDEVYFRGANFSDTRNYQVYFLKALDGSDPFSEVNKAEFVSLGLNVNGTEDVLTVRVPNHPDFERRSYYVVVTDVQNGQVVAEQVVKRQDGTYDEYAVIQADYKPSIVSVYPEKGPDTGGNVEIKANYVATLNIPDLLTTGNFKVPPSTLPGDEILVMQYDDGTYKSDPVTIERHVNMQIGKKVKFLKDSSGNLQIVKAAPDQIMVATEGVNDAEIDPKKDVVVEMQTTLTVKSGPNAGRKFVFNQVITKKDGFEFEPSTYTPIIDTLHPDVIQVEDATGGYSQFKYETLLSVKGDKFLVDRFVDAQGTVITRKPTVLIKKNDDNTFNNRYQLGFFPNEEYTGGGVTVRGIIKYKDGETDPTATVLTYPDGRPVPLEMTVINDDNEVVDGTGGNQIGQKILIRVPAISKIKDAGIKHLQVTNPVRKSPIFGKSAIKSDFLEFIKTSDIPVVESIKPSIVTVEGGETIVITGSNLQDGLRLYLDGEPIANFTRELDNTGNRIILTFKAPPGREGTTQLQVVNPGGGLAVGDFTYVKTFNKNPVFDSFTPPLGSYDTLVVVNGDNFLRPDPTAVTERGVDAFRLIGTRMLIDGREVNSYTKDPTGKIVFSAYTVPATEILIGTDAGKAVYSKFYQNAVVIDQASGDRVRAGVDASGSPTIKTPTEQYAIRYTGGGYSAYDKSGQLVGAATLSFSGGVTTIAIAGGPTFRATMNNQLVRIELGEDGELHTALADYADSITLKSAIGERFVVFYDFGGNAVLSNGKDKRYTLIVDPNNPARIVAEDSLGFTRPVTPNVNGIDLDGTQLNMITPYTVDPVTGRIDGNLTKVLSKNQLIFTVPYLTTGKGYKDLVVVNPDTKSASKTGDDGFYYISQTTSKPVITDVEPPKGSVDGGYYVTISGSDFEDDARVFIDSVEVPKKDTYVALDGKAITIKMPESIKNLNADYGVDEMAVPVVVVNPDGGSAGIPDGFTYIIPLSDPSISRIVPNGGSSNGGEIVEIIGYEFRFYEPYDNLVGGPGYEIGDPFIDQYKNGKWDDLLAPGVDPGAVTALPEVTNPYYSVYYTSPILPKIYFGEKEAKIVEYSKGFIKVLTPPHDAGPVDVYVINNDSGVSNKVTYTYTATKPVLNRIVPNFGRRQGQEPKDIYGSKLYRSVIYGYADDDEATIKRLDAVEALVRFGEIDNRKIPRIAPNSGLINNQRTTVNLDGGLTVNYYGDLGTVKVTLTENNVIYTRTFDYNNTTAYVPMGMLKNNAGDYYAPNGLKGVDKTVYSGDAYEFVRLEIAERRLFVERGYAPKVTYDNDTHVTVVTPSYYTIDTVNMTYTNTDGGQSSLSFTYTNPASEPKIYSVEPHVLSFDKTKWLVETSVNGGIDIEIIGQDFRENVEVFIGDKKAKVKEITTKTIGTETYDLIVATVPKGTTNDIEVLYPVMIQNEDKGLASSINLKDLLGPNYGAETLPYYFVYKKPLSGPRIDDVVPKKTSIYGGNTVVITGADFREGAYVIIGTRAGIPIHNAVISERGTKLTFTTPDNMTLGEKTVQVLNNDYGIAIKEKGITVVSAPTVLPGVLDEDGNPLTRIHVTGGQKIMLKGTGFAEDAKVYFGGEWLPVKPKDAIPESAQGVWRDDSLHYVKNGVPAKTVEFVDSQTLLVTTPEVTFEGKVSIVVHNADSGITDDSVKLEYTVPIPDDPMNLKVTVVDDRYIKLYDYVSKTAQYFEIYVYIGTKTNPQLTSNGYRDFRYLGITNIEPYKISQLPGFDTMNTADRIVFVVKGVNKFGPSGYSNLAWLTHQQLKDVKELGPEDLDGGLDVPIGEDYKVIGTGDTLDVQFAGKLQKPTLVVDASDRVGAGTSIKRLILPELLVTSGYTSIRVNFGDSEYRVTPVSANTAVFRSVADYYDAYARIIEDTSMTSARSYLTPRIRGKKQISKVYSIRFDASSNEVTRSFDTLSGTMDLVMTYSDAGLTPVQKNNVQLYAYNAARGTYVYVPAAIDRTHRRVTIRLKEAGDYVLMTTY